MTRRAGWLLGATAGGGGLLVATLLVLVLAAPSGGAPTYVPTAATAEIPPFMLALYQEAAATRCPGLPWPVVAAIGRVETNHGENKNVSSAGAMGPMQFMPATWRMFGIDANGDGIANILDPVDAVHSAVIYLCHFGGADPARLRSAIFAYNHANWYVDLVLEHAARYASYTGPAVFGSGLSDVGALLSNPNALIASPSRTDLQLGRIDPRVVAILNLLSANQRLGVGVLQTGHSKYVAGTNRVSNHWCGQAVDIFMVGDEIVTPRSRAARATTEYLAGLTGPLRPAEVGSPWYDMAHLPGHFANAAHQDHLHIGYGPRCVG